MKNQAEKQAALLQSQQEGVRFIEDGSAPTRGFEFIEEEQGEETALETFRLLDGRLLADVPYGELRAILAATERDVAMLKLAQRHHASIQGGENA